MKKLLLPMLILLTAVTGTRAAVKFFSNLPMCSEVLTAMLRLEKR